MNVLGIRCSNTDYTYAVMSGTKQTPQVVVCSTITYPQGYSKVQSLSWLLQEIEDLIKKHSISLVSMKRFEGRTKGNAYEDRVEHEAMVYLAGANCGLRGVFKKVNSTIAKNLGLKGRARYLAKSLNTSSIPSYCDYSEREKDAIHAGWSELL